MFFDQRRLPEENFPFDWDSIRRGNFSDKYFQNICRVLELLAEEPEKWQSETDSLRALLEIGQREVELQVFTRRTPYAIVAGTDEVLALLKGAAGYWKGEKFIPTYQSLEVKSLYDGEKVSPWEPVMSIQGRYTHFGYLETLILGILARQSKVATNVYEALVAARGKPVFFFSARYDLPFFQEHDGYAYKVAVDRYNYEHNTRLPYLISTDEQGKWFGEKGKGTTSHSYLLCFLRNTPQAMYYFARILPVEIKRIALVDVNNDCVRDSVEVAKLFFKEYRKRQKEGKQEEAEKFRLFGVRADTAENMRDKSVPPLGDPKLDLGVVPRLVWKMRQALDELPYQLDLEEQDFQVAKQYFRDIKIVCTGGFHPEKIELFERLNVPVDMYGIGSAFFAKRCDFTADVVRVKHQGQWIPMAKEGRKKRENPKLTRHLWK